MTPRRTFLTGTAAVAAGSVLSSAPGAASTAASPDAEIISIAEEYVRLSRLWCDIATEGGQEIGDTPLAISCSERQDAIQSRMDELEQLICDTRATTIEGVRAKALAAWCYAGDGGFEATAPIDYNEWMSWSVLADLLGRETGETQIQRVEQPVLIPPASPEKGPFTDRINELARLWSEHPKPSGKLEQDL
jgi:hypothetical protein